MGTSDAARALARQRWDNATPEDRERQADVMRRTRRGKCKLTTQQAADIKARIDEGEKRADLEREYRVSRALIGQVARGQYKAAQ